MRRWGLWIQGIALGAILSPAAAPGEPPAAWWSFDAEASRIEDRSGHGWQATGAGCSLAPGRIGMALRLNGSGGATAPHVASWAGKGGFAVECWIKSDVPPGPAMNILTKPGEFMLRVDPDKAGGTISFFVISDRGEPEPRARGPRLEAGKWRHLAASWDGKTARLWVNGALAASVKRGARAEGTGPFVIGGPLSAESQGEKLAGFRGLIDEARLYSAPLTDADAARQFFGFGAESAGAPRREARFRFDKDMQGWQADPETKATIREGALCATLPGDDSLLRVRGLAVDTAANPLCDVRMSATGGKRGVLVFIGDKGIVEIPFRLASDGLMRTHILRCAREPSWKGRIQAMALWVEGANGAAVRIESIALGAATAAPPDVRIASFAPERRIGGLNEPMTVRCWARNEGGPARAVQVRLTVPAGIETLDDPVQRIDRLDLDQQVELSWRIRARKPAEGDLKVEAACGSAAFGAMQRPVRFAQDPDAEGKAMAKGRVWMHSGYPRSMDFRHLWPQSQTFLEHNTAFLVDFIGSKIPAAQDLKRRYPDRLVLMQVNDEPNGIWGSWHVVPREFAVKEGLRFDTQVFPMPTFRGYWLLGAGTPLPVDMPSSAETVQFQVADVRPFISLSKAGENLRDALIYRRTGDQCDWGASEYASVVALDADQKTVTLKRWPREAVGEWKAFRKAEAWVAPSVGSVYRQKNGGVWIKTWIPNLTPFCPRDPETGLNAAEWWARHFANLWRNRIAAGEPHPDGYEFDGLRESRESDGDNDGVVDGCVRDGVNAWTHGLYDFFRMLREGGKGFEGANDALILADASNPQQPRCLSLLNGSENEEFPSFESDVFFPTGMDQFLVWTQYAAAPACPYLQARYDCDTHRERDWRQAVSAGGFQGDNFVRLSIAASCMGTGIFTYRTGGIRDRGVISDGKDLLEYPWDEYHAGREGVYNWLGAPLEEPQRRMDHLGADLLARQPEAGQWTIRAAEAADLASGPMAVDMKGRKAVRAAVLPKGVAPKAKVARASAASRILLLSPPTNAALDPAKEYCVEFWVSADPPLSAEESQRFGQVWRWIGVSLDTQSAGGVAQTFLAASQPRHVWLTLRPARPGACRVAFNIGGEPGPVQIADLRAREGCAEVFARRFEHGLALANGSAVAPFPFDIGKIGGGRAYRRFAGVQAPEINNGRPVGERLTLAPRDGILLKAE